MISAAALTFAVNAVITPLLPSDQGFLAVAASPIFLLRQSISALAAVCLVIAGAALAFDQDATRGSRATALFAALGSVALFAHEWTQIFFVRTFAIMEPSALQRVDGAPGLSGYDLGAIAALTALTLGWLAAAISEILRARLNRKGPSLVVAGFFAIPLLTGITGGHVAGTIIGSAILSLGWMFWGIGMARAGITAPPPG